MNFDIIELTFLDKDGIYTVIPAVSDPIDIYSDSNVPKVENPGLPNWLKYLLLGIALLVALPVLYWLVKFAVWLVTLLLKGIASVCRGIGNAAKKRKEKKKNE